MTGDTSQPGPSRTEPAARSGEEPGEVIALDQAQAQIRAPWAASIAGLLFAAFFTCGLMLIRASPLVTAATNDDVARIFRESEDWWFLVGSLYLLPFAGIMFLWFIAVVRDQLGEREDQFFATVFFGSGLLFVASLFTMAAVIGSMVVSVRYLRLGPPSAAEVDLVRALSYTLAFAISTRAAAVFLISLSTVALRSRAFPRWFAGTGYLFGAFLLVVVTVWDWVVLLLPVWVAAVSLFILRREWAPRRAATRREPAPRR